MSLMDIRKYANACYPWKPVIVPRVVTPLGSQAKLPGLRKSNSFKKLFAALKPVSETSDCKGCDRLLIDCVTPQDLKQRNLSGT